MASDRQQWRRAEAKWNQLAADKAFSAWPSLGLIAIICCDYSSEGSSVAGFQKEALATADNLRQWGGRPEVVVGPTANDIDAIIQDPRYSSIYTIGDGTLSSLILGPKANPPSPDTWYSWLRVSNVANHLKLGSGVQRQSGLMQRGLNVPLLVPVTADHRNVMAYVGLDFQPEGLGDPVNWTLQRVSDTPAITRDRIDTLPHLPPIGSELFRPVQ